MLILKKHDIVFHALELCTGKQLQKNKNDDGLTSQYKTYNSMLTCFKYTYKAYY